ncbi:MAG: sel1 repeat family protein [Magnetococcales bacterium]|nr:sel1 repeat family protein [Magnetococcales bacterium]
MIINGAEALTRARPVPSRRAASEGCHGVLARLVLLLLPCMLFLSAVAPLHADAYTRARHAAEQGNAAAQTALGVMHYLGRGGVLQNYQEAVKWFRLAAEKGNAAAQSNLGVMYFKGEGVRQDHKEAARWLRQAAEQGNGSAQSSLGEIYYRGLGVTQEYKEAARWFRLAAEQGRRAAQTKLGFMYYRGQGMPRDSVKAHMWLNLSASRGDKAAIKLRDLVTSRMTPEQLAKAQELAKHWKPSPNRQEPNPFLAPARPNRAREVEISLPVRQEPKGFPLLEI